MTSITPQSHPDYKNLQFVSIALSSTQLSCNGIRKSLAIKNSDNRISSSTTTTTSILSSTTCPSVAATPTTLSNNAPSEHVRWKFSEERSQGMLKESQNSGLESSSSDNPRRKNSLSRKRKSIGAAISTLVSSTNLTESESDKKVEERKGPVKKSSSRDLLRFFFVQANIQGIPQSVQLTIKEDSPCIFSGVLKENNRRVRQPYSCSNLTYVISRCASCIYSPEQF